MYASLTLAVEQVYNNYQSHTVLHNNYLYYYTIEVALMMPVMAYIYTAHNSLS